MIKRIDVSKRFSEVAIYNGVVYLGGQVPTDDSQDAYQQTKQVLAEIDKFLAKANTDKSKILMATVYLANMAYYDEMNRAWDEWVAENNAPPRAAVEARLANPNWKVEIVVNAAV
ncbi:RidA family protein [Actinobacillus equuli]|uniref:RidA family protein n=1 Tax=Actinobacillus equuli TaxID=718 RepID=UPI0024410FB9|nr:RidA family protein [Actinobacillus equuli]WGE75655.1 RidA family protein [Actinobacillus equuli subsp. haemolyticus]WGE76599.1 RidA family protein [Actinobacillus equuli subsp. haemolyticus]